MPINSGETDIEINQRVKVVPRDGRLSLATKNHFAHEM